MDIIVGYIIKRGYLIVFLVSIIVFFLAAYYNIGYFHPDEHYQIIEFAGFKLGWNNPTELAWEFKNMLRPTVQVWLCIVFFKFFSFFGCEDPYLLSYYLRLITAIYALIVINFFFNSVKQFISPKLHFVLYFLSFFLWFIPFISVRFSSETWSGLTFLLGFSFVFRDDSLNSKGFFLGILLGLAFLFRFQVGILILGLLLWMIIIRKDSWKYIYQIIMAFILVIQVGAILDALFYGQYTYTFWNYFNTNILNAVSERFGTSPWTEIFAYIGIYTLLPIGLVLICSLLVLTITEPSNPFLWCMIPFIIIHAIIPHKEIRFLFPIIWFAPIIIVMALQKLWKKPHGNLIYATRPILFFCFPIGLLNIYAVFMSITIPAGLGQKIITKNIAIEYGNKPIRIFHTPYGNPYQPWVGLSEKFYKTSNVFFTQIDHVNKIFNYDMASRDTIYLLAVRDYEINKRLINDITIRDNCQVDLKYSSRLKGGWAKFYKGTSDLADFQIFTLKKLL